MKHIGKPGMPERKKHSDPSKKQDKKIIEEKRKFWGMSIYKADKKVRSILYLALGTEGKRVFSQEYPRVKALAISFKD